ncbi:MULTISPECIES: Uma2 family endonuclease [Argonema]|uniref:Uma2 family endonuclease n=1 Tax=Argonema TaxID=2942761 RepID=UPI002013B189|nr:MULTISPECIES: Uma2 family endonuclease [Argonema]MCL1468235.1 Uma2 family endonuclease [Argonema galeatum A003/A1]MCL1471989.1 Uma2 family endonuclease [Argonema antarcticum A004/B2]
MTATQIRLWTVEEYHRMIDAGILSPDDKVELLEGKIVKMSPQRPPHAGTTQRTDRYLQNLLRDLAEIRVQLPITLSTSEPEPDIAVVRIDPNAYGENHPNANDIFLLIEISYTTLKIDREEKAPIYARANIPEYWILDISNRRVYIFRNPTESGYQEQIILNADAAIAPLAFPQITIPFSELFLP